MSQDAGSLSITAAMHDELSLAERDRRWRVVRDLMGRDGLDAIVTSPNPHRFDNGIAYTRYLSQLGGDGTAAVVFPTDGDVTAIVPPVPGPERLADAQSWVTDLRDIGLDWLWGAPIAARLRELEMAGGRIGLAGLAGNARAPEGSFIHGVHVALRELLPEAELVDASTLLDEARYVKGDEELDRLRTSVALAEAMIERLVVEARPGVAENVVYARMIATLLEHGGELPAMLLWSAGPTQGRNVFQAPQRPLEPGDIITVEADGRYQGYNGQVTAHAFLGEVPALYRELHDAQRRLTDRCLATLRPGVALTDLVELARAFSDESGFDCRLIMHGRGLGDDPPVVVFGRLDAKTAAWPILERTAFVVKPMVSARDPGSGAASFVYWGDTVVTRDGGAERLGALPAELLEIT